MGQKVSVLNFYFNDFFHFIPLQS